jgi:Domain of unknown function (DUF1737)
MYIILKGLTKEELMEQVNKHLASGWTCIGGLAIDGGPNYAIFHQAMFKANP